MIDIYVTSKRIRDAYKNAGKLSGVDPLLARAIIKIGDRSKDKVKVEDVELSALKMKPSQTTMKPGQSIAMALTMIIKQEVDSDLGAIISSDGYIMDGHHRWAAMILLQGGAGRFEGVEVGKGVEHSDGGEIWFEWKYGFGEPCGLQFGEGEGVIDGVCVERVER